MRCREADEPRDLGEGGGARAVHGPFWEKWSTIVSGTHRKCREADGHGGVVGRKGGGGGGGGGVGASLVGHGPFPFEKNGQYS